MRLIFTHCTHSLTTNLPRPTLNNSQHVEVASELFCPSRVQRDLSVQPSETVMGSKKLKRNALETTTREVNSKHETNVKRVMQQLHMLFILNYYCLTKVNLHFHSLITLLDVDLFQTKSYHLAHAVDTGKK